MIMITKKFKLFLLLLVLPVSTHSMQLNSVLGYLKFGIDLAFPAFLCKMTSDGSRINTDKEIKKLKKASKEEKNFTYDVLKKRGVPNIDRIQVKAGNNWASFFTRNIILTDSSSPSYRIYQTTPGSYQYEEDNFDRNYNSDDPFSAFPWSPSQLAKTESLLVSLSTALCYQKMLKLVPQIKKNKIPAETIKQAEKTIQQTLLEHSASIQHEAGHLQQNHSFKRYFYREVAATYSLLGLHKLFLSRKSLLQPMTPKQFLGRTALSTLGTSLFAKAVDCSLTIVKKRRDEKQADDYIENDVKTLKAFRHNLVGEAMIRQHNLKGYTPLSFSSRLRDFFFDPFHPSIRYRIKRLDKRIEKLEAEASIS